MLRTCVTSHKKFRVGLHRPCYTVRNLRYHDLIMSLGKLPDGSTHDNRRNFPPGDVSENNGRWIYEIPNAFAFRGTTYIDSGWAAARAEDPGLIYIDKPGSSSLRQVLEQFVTPQQRAEIYRRLPTSMLYDLAANSTDADELVTLAHQCCVFVMGDNDVPTGLEYLERRGAIQAAIDDFELFETIANNPWLPDCYKEVMVLRPGVQGGSEIVGEFSEQSTHVFEYLRRNSYIPWGHYAANMANDAIRYQTADLTPTDIRGLRSLYYQRMVVTLAEQLDIPFGCQRRGLTPDELEQLRFAVLEKLKQQAIHPATLWGWNFGYDFSGSGYRLHASHQMIHQQFAMVPETVATLDGGMMASYSCGDQVAEVVALYKQENQRDFFTDYIACIHNNSRCDDRTTDSSLIVHADANVLLFVPKAQVSQWELQLLVIADVDGCPVGNVLEADPDVRASIDTAILIAQKIFAGLGAAMVTSIEFSKRLAQNNGQRLLYSFLPKLPWSMGAFSEAQQRYICGHFPEDFATACRAMIADRCNS